MSNIITSLRNPELLFLQTHFGIGEGNKDRQKYLCAYFRAAAKAAPFTALMDEIAEHIPRIKFRLRLLEEYEEDFFSSDGEHKQSATIIAALYARILDEIDEYDEDEYSPQNDLEEIESGLTELASLIYEESERLVRGEEISSTPSREGIFCAHLCALEYIHEIRHELNRYSKEYCSDFLNNTVSAWMKFVDRNTELGQDLYAEIGDLAASIRSAHPSIQAIDFLRFRL